MNILEYLGPEMALLIYTEMAWVIASPSYLCSHNNVFYGSVTYLLLQTSKKMGVYVNYI